MENNNDDTNKRGIGRRGFLTTSVLSTAGVVAGSTFLSHFADAEPTNKNHTIMNNKKGQGRFATREWQHIPPMVRLK